MNCIVTAGPTYEPLDEVRRLTNFSTGALGSALANFLVERGHGVILLLGELATYRGPQLAQEVIGFTTTSHLHGQLAGLSTRPCDAVFHVAAVSDFGFGKIWERSFQGELTESRAAKISTQSGTLLAELVPTQKIIGSLRAWFPQAHLVGWKYELDGDRAGVLAKAGRQMVENQTDACVANGRAYGPGFGWVTRLEAHRHFADAAALFAGLEKSCLP